MTFLLCDPGWYVQKSDVQNKGDENIRTLTHCVLLSFFLVQRGFRENPCQYPSYISTCLYFRRKKRDGLYNTLCLCLSLCKNTCSRRYFYIYLNIWATALLVNTVYSVDIILLTQGYYHRGIRLNTMEWLCLYSLFNSLLLLSCVIHCLCFVFTVFLVSLHGDSCKSAV